MPGQNIIEIGFDIDKLSAGKKQVLDEFADLFDKLGKYDGTKFDPLGKGGLTELRKSVKDGAAAMGDYQSATEKYIQTITDQVNKQKEAKKATDDLGASQKGNAAAADAYSTSQDRLRRQAAENKVAQEQVAASIRRIRDDFNNAIISEAEYTKRLDPLLAQQLALKVANTDVTKTLTVLEKQFQSTGGSTVQLENRLKELQGVYDKLSPEGRSAEPGKALLKEIQDVDAAFKALKGDTGRFQDNVGNYSGAFQNAFKVLQDQLAATKTQMKDLTGAGTQAVNKFGFDPNRHKDVSSRTGASVGTSFVSTENLAQFDAAASKAEVLETNIERLSIGFKTTRQESRAFAEAATQVGLALGLESEEFQTFDKALGHSQNAINDIKAASKFQASDAKFIVGLADAASTLAGGFGAASAASALFGDENQDLQKQMAKFQELLVLINGLQAVANGLQAESGGMQLLLSARTNLLNAAKATQLLLTTRAIQVIAAETAETAVNAEVKEVATVATGERAVAEGVQTAAVAANTEATVANTAAQTAAKGAGLGTIAIAAGIAAVAIGAGVALALLTAKLFGYKGAAGLTTDQQKALAKATGDLNEALNQQAKVLDDLDVSQKRYYTNLIQNAQDAGASQYALLLLQERLDKSQADAAQAEVDRLGANDSAYSKQAQRIQQLLGLQQLANEEVKKISAIPESEQTSSQKKALEADLKLLDVYSAQLGPEQKRFDDMRAAREKLAETTQKVASDETRFTKLSLDEQLDLVEKAEELRGNLVKARNAIVLGDDRSTLAQRLTALRSNTKAENDILDAQIKKVTDNPSSFLNGLLTPQAQQQVDAANEKRKENILAGLENQRKVNEDYRLRNLNATIETNKILIQEDIDRNKAIVDNDDKSLDERTEAYRQYYEGQRAIIDQDFNLRLKSAGFSDQEVATIKNGGKVRVAGKKITDQELLKEETDYQAKLIGLNNNTQKEVNAIITSWAKKNADAVALANKQNDVNDPTNVYNQQLLALNESLEKKLISVREYQQKRKSLEESFNISQLATQVQADDKSLAALKKNQDDIAEQVQKNKLDLVKAYENGDQENIDSALGAQKALADAADQSNALIIAGTAKRNEDLKKLNEYFVSNYLDLKKQQSAAELNLANQTAQLGENLVTAGYEKEINRLQKQIDNNNKLKEAETSRINNSTLSEQEKANALIVLGKQADSENEALQKKQRDEKVKEAKFSKAVKVAEIGGSTAVSVISLAQKEAEAQAQAALLAANPLTAAYAPVAAASAAVIGTLIGLTIASGAAQIAAVLATPVPAYRHGTSDHPGGLAVVGDGFEKEIIKEPGKQAYWSPAVPTTLQLRPHTQVMPLSRISEMISQGMFVNHDGILAPQQIDNTAELREIKGAIGWLGGVVKESARANRVRIPRPGNLAKELAHAAFIRKNVLD